MGLQLHVILAIACYIFICGFLFYFTMVADPDKSDMGFLLQVALRRKFSAKMRKGLGEKRMGVITSIMDQFFVFIYFFVVLGCWTVVFFYIYPWISLSSHVSNFHKYIGYAVFVSCFDSWRLANKSKPGFITATSFKRFDHFPYDNFIFLQNRRCQTTNLIRIPRSKCKRHVHYILLYSYPLGRCANDSMFSLNSRSYQIQCKCRSI